MRFDLGEIKNKILTDIKIQLILLTALTLFIGYIFLKPSGKEKPKTCFNTDLKIWAPFNRNDFLSFISSFASKYCLRIVYEEIKFDDLEKRFIYSLAENKPPDIIYAPNFFVFRNKKYLEEGLDKKLKLSKKFFKEEIDSYGIPVNIDSLLFVYNKKVFQFLNYNPPKTLEELNDLIKDFKDKGYKDFYLVSLGTKEIKNKKEIILVLKSLKKSSIQEAINTYFSYSDENSPNFVLARNLGKDEISLFSSIKSASAFVFYEDLKKILKLNPKIDYEVSQNPIETFPPSSKNFVKVFYFTLPKASQKKDISFYFLSWLFSGKNYANFIEKFDLIPNFTLQNLSEEKEAFIKGASFGSSYLEIISQENYNDFEKILNIWENNKEEGQRALSLLNLKF